MRQANDRKTGNFAAYFCYVCRIGVGDSDRRPFGGSPALRPETGLPHGLEHFVIYWATGVAFALGYEMKLGLLATLLALFSGAVEFAQLFVPGRHARLSDFIVDALATIVGAMTVALLSQKPVLRTAQTADPNMDESRKV